MDLKEIFAPLAQNVAVDLNGAPAAETVLYTIPAAKIGMPAFLILHGFSAACGTAVITVGKSGGSCDEFLGDQTLTNIAAAGDYLILMPIPHGTAKKLVEFAAAEEITIEITTAEGGALACEADVYGRLKDA